MVLHHLGFSEIWLVFFNLLWRSGDRCEPQSLVACELVSARDILVERPALLLMRVAPYPVGAHSLYVTFEANLALGCHLTLGWPMPQRLMDLKVEFRNLTNGRTSPCGVGLVGALVWFGLSASSVIGADFEPRGKPADARRSATAAFCNGVVSRRGASSPPRSLYGGGRSHGGGRRTHRRAASRPLNASLARGPAKTRSARLRCAARFACCWR